MTENELSKIVFEAGLKIHRKFGPGLFENTYEACLEYELLKKGLKVEKQKTMPIQYEDLIIENAYRLDLLVEDKLIVEIKAVHELNEIHFSQILTYLKLLDLKLGLLINFNVPLFKDGVRRVSNGYFNDVNQ
jgi:GxxExxY protein